MPTFIRGGFQLPLGFTPLEGELARQERQIAWALQVQLGSRVALRGKVDERGEDHFRGEVLAEGFDEIEAFLAEARALASGFPVGDPGVPPHHLGAFILALSELVLHPFLEKWQAEYRHWWGVNRPNGEPFIIQANFPGLSEMLDDWIALRRFGRAISAELAKLYGFVDVAAAVTPELQRGWS